MALPKGDFRIYGNGGFDGSRINSDNSTEVEFALAEGERALTIQLWKSYVDRLELYVVSPSGEQFRMPEEGTGVRYMLGGDSTLSIVHGTPTPYTISQEIYMEWTAGEGVTLPAGIWSIALYPREIREGVCNLWMSGIEGKRQSDRIFNASHEYHVEQFLQQQIVLFLWGRIRQIRWQLPHFRGEDLQLPGRSHRHL